MSAIYSDPPRSTTQILHPEKYFDRREDPVAVAIPDLTASSRQPARVGRRPRRVLPGRRARSPSGRHRGPARRRRLAATAIASGEDAAGRFTIAYRVIVASPQMAAALADQLRASVERRHPELAGKASGRTGGLVTWA
jgi:hypothetical protein